MDLKLWQLYMASNGWYSRVTLVASARMHCEVVEHRFPRDDVKGMSKLESSE